MKLPVASYALPSRAPQRLVNCYAQQTPGKQPVELVGCAGVTQAHALQSPGRGLHVMRGNLYAVAGNTLYRITGAAESVGTLSGSDPVQMADNGTQLVTDTGYLYDGSTVALIADSDRVSWASVGFCDSYIVAVEAHTGRFVGSALNDASDWDALDYATAEGSPDDLVTLMVDHRQVVLFGVESTEVWWNQGGSGFPFARLAGGFLELGCLARLGVAKADNSVFWLASDRTIRRLSGTTPVRVSQHGVEDAIAKYANVADCEAFSFTWNGHIFVTFRFPSANACWVYSATTGEWHERASYDSTGWNIVHAVNHDGHVWVQHADGRVGYLDAEVHTEFGGILRREWTYPQVYGSGKRLFHGSLEVMMRTGAVTSGFTPYLHLEVSDDGGNTWRAMPRRNFGRIGQYSQRITWHALGSSYDRVYRCSVSDAVPVHVLDTMLELV